MYEITHQRSNSPNALIHLRLPNSYLVCISTSCHVYSRDVCLVRDESRCHVKMYMSSRCTISCNIELYHAPSNLNVAWMTYCTNWLRMRCATLAYHLCDSDSIQHIMGNLLQLLLDEGRMRSLCIVDYKYRACSDLDMHWLDLDLIGQKLAMHACHSNCHELTLYSHCCMVKGNAIFPLYSWQEM